MSLDVRSGGANATEEVLSRIRAHMSGGAAPLSARVRRRSPARHRSHESQQQQQQRGGPPSTLSVPLVSSGSSSGVHGSSVGSSLAGSSQLPSFMGLLLHSGATHPALQSLKSVTAHRALEAAQLSDASRIYASTTASRSIASLSSGELMMLRAMAFAHPDIQVRLLLFWTLAQRRDDGLLSYSGYKALYTRFAKRLLGRAFRASVVADNCEADWARDWGGVYPGASVEFARTQGLPLGAFLQSAFEVFDLFISAPCRLSVPLGGPGGATVPLPNYDAYIEAMEKMLFDITHRIDDTSRTTHSATTDASDNSSNRVPPRHEFRLRPMSEVGLQDFNASDPGMSAAAYRAYAMSAIYALLQHPNSELQTRLRENAEQDAADAAATDEEDGDASHKHDDDEKEEKTSEPPPEAARELAAMGDALASILPKVQPVSQAPSSSNTVFSAPVHVQHRRRSRGSLEADGSKKLTITFPSDAPAAAASTTTARKHVTVVLPSIHAAGVTATTSGPQGFASRPPRHSPPNTASSSTPREPRPPTTPVGGWPYSHESEEDARGPMPVTVTDAKKRRVMFGAGGGSVIRSSSKKTLSSKDVTSSGRSRVSSPVREGARGPQVVGEEEGEEEAPPDHTSALLKNLRSLVDLGQRAVEARVTAIRVRDEAVAQAQNDANAAAADESSSRRASGDLETDGEGGGPEVDSSSTSPAKVVIQDPLDVVPDADTAAREAGLSEEVATLFAKVSSAHEASKTPASVVSAMVARAREMHEQTTRVLVDDLPAFMRGDEEATRGAKRATAASAAGAGAAARKTKTTEKDKSGLSERSASQARLQSVQEAHPHPPSVPLDANASASSAVAPAANSDSGDAVPKALISSPASYAAAVARLTTASERNTWHHNRVLLGRAETAEWRAERRAEEALDATLRRTKAKAARLAERQAAANVATKRSERAANERADTRARDEELRRERDARRLERARELAEKRHAVLAQRVISPVASPRTGPAFDFTRATSSERIAANATVAATSSASSPVAAGHASSSTASSRPRSKDSTRLLSPAAVISASTPATALESERYSSGFSRLLARATAGGHEQQAALAAGRFEQPLFDNDMFDLSRAAVALGAGGSATDDDDDIDPTLFAHMARHPRPLVSPRADNAATGTTTVPTSKLSRRPSATTSPVRQASSPRSSSSIRVPAAGVIAPDAASTSVTTSSSSLAPEPRPETPPSSWSTGPTADAVLTPPDMTDPVEPTPSSEQADAASSPPEPLDAGTENKTREDGAAEPEAPDATADVDVQAEDASPAAADKEEESKQQQGTGPVTAPVSSRRPPSPTTWRELEEALASARGPGEVLRIQRRLAALRRTTHTRRGVVVEPPLVIGLAGSASFSALGPNRAHPHKYTSQFALPSRRLVDHLRRLELDPVASLRNDEEDEDGGQASGSVSESEELSEDDSDTTPVDWRRSTRRPVIVAAAQPTAVLAPSRSSPSVDPRTAPVRHLSPPRATATGPNRGRTVAPTAEVRPNTLPMMARGPLRPLAWPLHAKRAGFARRARGPATANANAAYSSSSRPSSGAVSPVRPMQQVLLARSQTVFSGHQVALPAPGPTVPPLDLARTFCTSTTARIRRDPTAAASARDGVTQHRNSLGIITGGSQTARPPPRLASSLHQPPASRVDWSLLAGVHVKPFASSRPRTGSSTGGVVSTTTVGGGLSRPSRLEEDLVRLQNDAVLDAVAAEAAAAAEDDETRLTGEEAARHTPLDSLRAPSSPEVAARELVFARRLASRLERGLAPAVELRSEEVFAPPGEVDLDLGPLSNTPLQLARNIDLAASARHERMGRSTKFEPPGAADAQPATGEAYERLERQKSLVAQRTAQGIEPDAYTVPTLGQGAATTAVVTATELVDDGVVAAVDQAKPSNDDSQLVAVGRAAESTPEEKQPVPSSSSRPSTRPVSRVHERSRSHSSEATRVGARRTDTTALSTAPSAAAAPPAPATSTPSSETPAGARARAYAPTDPLSPVPAPPRGRGGKASTNGPAAPSAPAPPTGRRPSKSSSSVTATAASSTSRSLSPKKTSGLHASSSSSLKSLSKSSSGAKSKSKGSRSGSPSRNPKKKKTRSTRASPQLSPFDLVPSDSDEDEAGVSDARLGDVNTSSDEEDGGDAATPLKPVVVTRSRATSSEQDERTSTATLTATAATTVTPTKDSSSTASPSSSNSRSPAASPLLRPEHVRTPSALKGSRSASHSDAAAPPLSVSFAGGV